MLLGARRIVWLTLLLSAIGSSIVLPYTFHVSYGLYRAVRMLDIIVNNFVYDILDGQGWMNTTIIVQNPSDYSFKDIRIVMKIFLNGEYFSIVQGKYSELSASSNTTIIFNSSLSSYKIETLRKHERKNWEASLYLWIKIPIFEKTYALEFKKKIIV